MGVVAAAAAAAVAAAAMAMAPVLGAEGAEGPPKAPKGGWCPGRGWRRRGALLAVRVLVLAVAAVVLVSGQGWFRSRSRS